MTRIALQGLNDPQQFQHVNSALSSLVAGNEGLGLAKQSRQLRLCQARSFSSSHQRSADKLVLFWLNPHRQASGPLRVGSSVKSEN
jgi:hypothetical protein